MLKGEWNLSTLLRARVESGQWGLSMARLKESVESGDRRFFRVAKRFLGSGVDISCKIKAMGRPHAYRSGYFQNSSLAKVTASGRDAVRAG